MILLHVCYYLGNAIIEANSASWQHIVISISRSVCFSLNEWFCIVMADRATSEKVTKL